MGSMTGELDVLRRVSQVLDEAGLDYMLTGSMALAYYATPRMTRDIDIVIALKEHDIARLQVALGDEFYIDPDAARQAVRQERMFNLMHMDSAIKIDLVVRKSSDYRQLEFQRRRLVDFGGVPTWIVSCEDLILSKLDWARASGSELQHRDIHALLAGAVDMHYLHHWATQLGMESALLDLLP